jgi:hypothetical protein
MVRALAPIAAATVFCGLMAMEGGEFLAAWRPVLRLLLLLALLAPAAAWVIGHLLGCGAEAAGWMALVAAGPVSAVAVTNTLVLGLPARPVALLALLSTLAAPLTLPLVAWVCGLQSMPPATLAGRAALVILLPMALAGGLRHVPAFRDGRVVEREDWKAIAGLSLAALALARMHQVAPQVLADPAAALWATLLAWIACSTGAVLALLVRWSAGWRGAMLAGGCRGGALVWAVVAPYLPPQGELFMALTIPPIYGLPALVSAASGQQARRPSPI